MKKTTPAMFSSTDAMSRPANHFTFRSKLSEEILAGWYLIAAAEEVFVVRFFCDDGIL